MEKIQLRSARLPKRALFRGVGAIVWKNLVVARRSKRELVLAFVFTLVFTTPLTAMLWMHHDFVSKGIETSRQDAEEFQTGIALMLGFLAFLLQRTFPFDFRCDGHHLVGFRTLPVSPFVLALAEIAVPTGLCLAFQALGIAALVIYARFHWATNAPGVARVSCDCAGGERCLEPAVSALRHPTRGRPRGNRPARPGR